MNKELLGFLVVFLVGLPSLSIHAQSIKVGEVKLGEEKVIEINPDLKVESRLSDVFTVTEYISLEESAESLIGSIGYLYFVDDKIIISDTGSQRIMIFTDEGKFLRSFGVRGQGPGEYNRLNHIAIDEDLEMIIVASDFKFIWFDFQGNFIKEIKSVFAGAAQFELINSNTLVVYTEYGLLDDERSAYDLYYLDSKGKKKTKYVEIFPNRINARSIMGLYRYFSRNSTGQELYLTRSYSREILSLTEDGVEVKYLIDFGRRNLPDDYLETSLYDPSILNPRERITRMTNEGYVKLTGGAILETPSWIQIIHGNAFDRVNAFYNLKLKRHTYSFGNTSINDLDGSNSIINRWIRGEDLVSMVYPSTLRKSLEEGRTTNPEMLRRLLEFENVENPILRFVRPKN